MKAHSSWSVLMNGAQSSVVSSRDVRLFRTPDDVPPDTPHHQRCAKLESRVPLTVRESRHCSDASTSVHPAGSAVAVVLSDVPFAPRLRVEADVAPEIPGEGPIYVYSSRSYRASVVVLRLLERTGSVACCVGSMKVGRDLPTEVLFRGFLQGSAGPARSAVRRPVR